MTRTAKIQEQQLNQLEAEFKPLLVVCRKGAPTAKGDCSEHTRTWSHNSQTWNAQKQNV